MRPSARGSARPNRYGGPQRLGLNSPRPGDVRSGGNPVRISGAVGAVDRKDGDQDAAGRLGLAPDPEFLYVGALFHDLGLTGAYGTNDIRFEVDAANAAKSFLLDRADIDAVTAAHPRPDVKNRILAAFTEGNKHRPDTTFGNVDSDVLDAFCPGFERTNFVDIIRNSDWTE